MRTAGVFVRIYKVCKVPGEEWLSAECRLVAMTQVVAGRALIGLRGGERLAGFVKDTEDAIYGVVDIGLIGLDKLMGPELGIGAVAELGDDRHMDIGELLGKGHTVGEYLALVAKEGYAVIGAWLVVDDGNVVEVVFDTVSPAIDTGTAHVGLADSEGLMLGLGLIDLIGQ